MDNFALGAIRQHAKYQRGLKRAQVEKFGDRTEVNTSPKLLENVKSKITTFL